jgi:hypothetical protein
MGNTDLKIWITRISYVIGWIVLIYKFEVMDFVKTCVESNVLKSRLIRYVKRGV